MGFEQKVLTDVTNARADAVAAGSQGPAQQAAAENTLTSTLRSLFAVVENYPELKANQNVLELQEQLTDDREPDLVLASALQRVVLDFNTAIATFPNVLLAGPSGLHEAGVLRRRARGRERPERGPQPELTRRTAGGTVAGTSFYEQIAANRRNSFLMAAFVVVLLALLGFTIGFAVFGSPAGGVARRSFAVLLGA